MGGAVARGCGRENVIMTEKEWGRSDSWLWWWKCHHDREGMGRAVARGCGDESVGLLDFILWAMKQKEQAVGQEEGSHCTPQEPPLWSSPLKSMDLLPSSRFPLLSVPEPSPNCHCLVCKCWNPCCKGHFTLEPWQPVCARWMTQARSACISKVGVLYFIRLRGNKQKLGRKYHKRRP